MATNQGTRGCDHDVELSKVCQSLWELDENRLVPGKDYEINLQAGTKSYWTADKAKYPLFSYVTREVLDRPTYAKFISLLDNYESSTGTSEVVTEEEIKENRDFINSITETKVMKHLHGYLVSKGLSSPDLRQFKQQLYNIWFKLYRRTRGSRALDSSAFEHVFVGETRGAKDVIGFHNWIQFYLQEKAGNVDYQGYILGRKPEEGSKSHLITIKFKWNREVKPMGSTFIGTSPEFEMALYTLVFLCCPGEKVYLSFCDMSVLITCYKHGLNLGTAYPKDADI